jgi:Tfp pilus assembly PilM family ATPase
VLDEVVRSVRFFETQAGTQITKILLTGAGAEAPNAVEMFAAADLPPATLVDPLAALQRDPSVSPPPALTLAAAAGLATRGAGMPAAREVPWR